MERIPLACLGCGETARLSEINASFRLQRRLCELGFLKGTELTCIHIAPAGSPIAVWVRGTIIAIRRNLCEKILVERCC